MSGPATRYSAKRDLTSGSLAWNMVRLAGPMAIGAALHSLYMLVDALWLGRWGKKALAAQGVCWPLVFVTMAAAMGLAAAGTALVSQYEGADQHRRAEHAAGQTFLLLGGLVLLVTAAMYVLAPWILKAVQVPSHVQPVSLIYLRIMLLAMPMVSFMIAYGACLRALGDTVTLVIVTAAGNALNAVLDPLLIFGWGPFPSFGTGGAALASLIARVIEAYICYRFLCAGRSGLRVRLADLKPDPPLLRQLLRVGTPLAMNRSSDSLGFLVFQAIINSLGATVISAVTVGFRIIWFFNIPARVTAVAAAPVVGQALGAGKPGLARRAVKWGAVFVAGVLLLPLILLTLYGKLVARAFIEDPAVIVEAGKFFAVVPASSYLFGVLMVLLAAFYGSGHTTPAMVIGIVRLWVLRVPAALLLTKVFGWGSTGAYTAMVLGNVVCAVLALGMFLRGGWQQAVVETGNDRAGEQGSS